MNAANIRKKMHIWRLRHISERYFVLILSVLVGAGAGLAAVILKTLVRKTYVLLMQIRLDVFGGANILLLIFPAIGIILTVLFLKYIVRNKIGHGIPNVLYAISRGGGKMPRHNMYSSIIASTITVAFGGSVGLEAPIATTGSAIGSNIGQWFHLKHKNIILLLGCGAAGAIAGIFKAPIAGILFVLEILMFDISMTAAIPLLISSITASTLAYFLMGTDVQFAFQIQDAFQISQIPFFMVLGLFCAMVSVYFLRVNQKIESSFARINRQWVKILVGGTLLGILIFLCPPLFGEGYSQLNDLLHGDPNSFITNSFFISPNAAPWIMLLGLFGIIALKAVATSVTIGSGGVGGTFGPSLVIGGLSGFFVAALINQTGLQLPLANFALVGMAGVMAGVMHAPLMATFLIAEITGGYGLFAPLLVTTTITYICVRPFERHSIYTRKLAKHGDLLTHNKDKSAWQLMDMQKLIETNFVIVRSGDKLRDLITAIESSRRNIFPVLDENDKFLGVIVLDDVRKIIFKPELYDKYSVDELMYPLSEGDCVRITDSMSDVVNKFKVGQRYNLVVIDNENNYIGFLSRANTFSAYRQFVSEFSDE